MIKYNIVEGDLIQLAKEGAFDVIAHGCNCFCRMKRGIAPQMASAFACDRFMGERPFLAGDINKLGTIDIGHTYIAYEGGDIKVYDTPVNKSWQDSGYKLLKVVNAYTQYQWSTKTKPFDYDAFTLCMRKMNHIFKGLHIGLPQIGSHLAGGDWETIEGIILGELKDCEVTVVVYKP